MSGDICEACGREEPPVQRKKTKKRSKKDAGIGWICCDSCSKWFHNMCVRVSQDVLADISAYLYLCEQCTVIGSLIPKNTNTSATGMKVIAKQIEELVDRIKKIESEIAALQNNVRKQFDRVQNKIQSNVLMTEKQMPTMTISNVEQKLEVIDKGVKLANICSRSVNSFRISINKVPYQTGENVRSIVQNFLSFLGIQDSMSHVTTCFRLPVKPSKWTDRSITPTILVVFDSVGLKTDVLQKYFKKHKEAKLCNLKSGLPLEYRFTVNEMLSIGSFRIRNLALRMKQNDLVESVYVQNDSVSVRLPGQKKYIPIEDISQLLGLVKPDYCINESSIFYDAESAECSLQN